MNRFGAVLLSSRRRSADFTAEREALVPGTYDPGPDTTGVSPNFDQIKTVMNSGALVPGTTYTNVEFNYIVIPPVGDTPIIFRNCFFKGPNPFPNGGAIGLVKLYVDGHVPMEFYDCSFIAASPHPVLNGLHGYRFKARRCNIAKVSDALSTFRSTNNTPDGNLEVDVQQCWLHDLVWFSKADCAARGVTTPADGMHNDIWQQQGGAGAIFKYNTASAYTHPDYFNNYFDNTGRCNGNVTYQTNVGTSLNSDVQFNLFSGGRSGWNFTHSGGRYLGNVGTWKNNRFVRDQSVASILRPTTNFTADFGSGGTANVYTDNGQVVPLTNG